MKVNIYDIPRINDELLMTIQSTRPKGEKTNAFRRTPEFRINYYPYYRDEYIQNPYDVYCLVYLYRFNSGNFWTHNNNYNVQLV